MQAGLLAAKAASADAAPELTRTEPAPAKAKRGTPLKPDDVFYGKGDATASSFRPWYWSYEREGEEAPSPQTEAVAPPATPPSADAKVLQQRLAEAAAQSLSPPEPPPDMAKSAPETADIAPPAPPAETATAPDPAPPESRAPEEPPAETASSTDVSPPSQEPALPETRADAEHGRPAAEPWPAPPAVPASTAAAPPAPRVERPAETRPERPHQRARRALRGQVEAAAPPPEAPPAVAEDRPMAPAVVDSAPVAPLPAEPAAAASTPADAEPAEAAAETLATTIEAEMSRRRAGRGQPAPAAEPHRADRYQDITGSSLLAELAAAREARTGLPAPKASRESNLAASRVSRPLLDRVMTYGGIALIVVIAFLALSPATQYAPVARLTHLFN